MFTVSKRYFALYSHFSKDHEGIYLFQPYYAVREITVVPECRFPHFQQFAVGNALLMVYELWVGAAEWVEA